MNKYLKNILIAVMLMAFFVPFLALAADPSCQPPNYCIPNPFGENSTIWTILDRILNFLIIISFSIATIMIIWAGYMFITAMGDPEKVKTAKKLILYVIIGLVVVLCAKGIVGLLGSILGVETPYGQQNQGEWNGLEQKFE